jgi:aminocarboxymuconate-semialdehyde decarboxylase
LVHRGVAIGSNVDGVNLDAPEFGPFFKTVEALGVPIFIHPVNALGADRLAKNELNNFIGFVTDTAVAAGSLIFGGVMKAFPNLKIYLAHGGGTCPFIRGRWDHGWEHRLKGPKIGKAPSEYLKLFYADALVHSKQSLEYVVDVFGKDHIMVGTDYPYDMGHPYQPAWIRDSGFLSTSSVKPSSAAPPRSCLAFKTLLQQFQCRFGEGPHVGLTVGATRLQRDGTLYRPGNGEARMA